MDVEVVSGGVGVPPLLIAAWIREYRNSETLEKLDDILTPGIRRTRSVPQGDLYAADLCGTAVDTPAAMFCEMCQNKMVTACGKRVSSSSACR